MKNFTFKGSAALLMLLLFGEAINRPTVEDKVNGTLSYKSKSKTFESTIKYVYLVEGATDLNPSERIRRLIFSANDMGNKLKSASTMRDSDTALTEGFEIDLVKGPRYNYWMVLNNGLVQYSGTIPPENLVLTTDSPTQLAGTFKQDNSAAGGPAIDVRFSVGLLKKLK
ncbi:hypothetical protein [Runella sp.]|uniref:hypothetical protein n=1 Tax=Runella sp. TaxID=1960881 RepID=UPI003D13497C